MWAASRQASVCPHAGPYPIAAAAPAVGMPPPCWQMGKVVRFSLTHSLTFSLPLSLSLRCLNLVWNPSTWLYPQGSCLPLSSECLEGQTDRCQNSFLMCASLLSFFPTFLAWLLSCKTLLTCFGLGGPIPAFSFTVETMVRISVV